MIPKHLPSASLQAVDPMHDIWPNDPPRHLTFRGIWDELSHQLSETDLLLPGTPSLAQVVTTCFAYLELCAAHAALPRSARFPAKFYPHLEVFTMFATEAPDTDSDATFFALLLDVLLRRTSTLFGFPDLTTCRPVIRCALHQGARAYLAADPDLHPNVLAWLADDLYAAICSAKPILAVDAVQAIAAEIASAIDPELRLDAGPDTDPLRRVKQHLPHDMPYEIQFVTPPSHAPQLQALRDRLQTRVGLNPSEVPSDTVEAKQITRLLTELDRRIAVEQRIAAKLPDLPA